MRMENQKPADNIGFSDRELKAIKDRIYHLANTSQQIGILKDLFLILLPEGSKMEDLQREDLYDFFVENIDDLMELAKLYKHEVQGDQTVPILSEIHDRLERLTG